MSDLAARFEMILDALESDHGWATNRLVYGKVILGNLDGIEAGVRQMIRKRPLESAEIILASGATLLVPTADEILRIKAFLVVRRNLTRDYLDVAALVQHAGMEHSAGVLSHIDEYYADQRGDGDGVATQVARQLADPRPKDVVVTRQLGSYRRLDQRWADWDEVRRVLSDVATTIVALEDP
jgi:hypothetical protein